MLSGDVGNQMLTHSGCVSIFVSGIMDKQGFSVDENFLEIKEGGRSVASLFMDNERAE